MKSPLEFFFNYEIISKPPETPYSLLVNKKTKEHLLLKEVQLDSLNIKQIVETLEEHRSLEHEHLLGLLDYSIGEEEYGRVLRAFYKVGTHSLLQEIRARQDQQSALDEQELWGILYGVVMALSYLQRNSIGYGVVSLESIYLTQDGKTKVIDPSVASNPLILSSDKYYSPEMLKILVQENGQQQDINIFKSDVFVLALCLIHCSILQPVNECLNYQTGQVDFDLLEETLGLLPESYSEDIVKLIVKMLDENAETRPDFIELENYLSQICVSEPDFGEKSKQLKIIPPMTTDTEDIKGESVYPSEITDGEVIDKIDGEEDDQYEMPKISIGGQVKDASILENTLNLSDSLQDAQYMKTFSSNNSIDMQQYTNSISTVSRMKQSVKGSKHVKEKVIPSQSYQTLNYSLDKKMKESTSLAPYLPEKQEQLFTDPKLLMMLKQDLKRLSERTATVNMQDKENMALN